MLNIAPEIKKKIKKYINFSQSSSLVLKINDISNLENINENTRVFINLELVNNIRRINKFHEKVNCKLNKNDFYIICSENLEERRKRVWQKAPLGFKFFLRIIDFIFKRVLPKLPFIKALYFSVTGGHNRVMSKAEILGRLISCGFEILEYFEYKNLFYVVSKKLKLPDYNLNPSYGPLFKMKRIGYKKNIIEVYKVRTMYPFSEYCQDLIIKENKLLKSGKIANDFRITSWGKFFRKYWIDEIPMLFNLIKCEINLVGVRPISKGYFNIYPKKNQDLRIKVKPGLLPPYYADLPKNFDEILKSEENYINKKLKNPFYTDFIYFFKIIKNIFKGHRSQ